ncbi:hypothetical protein FEM21_19620 [Flavobacterium seoulense]|uniref:Uncharacterized protein n=1 Tax=Flavobacterium seoulense TaxID=1492738 RepID=A0A066WLR5_9FLAO|nr:hypothetical protein FEM21_19620 [Flavobacterium seoulense]
MAMAKININFNQKINVKNISLILSLLLIFEITIKEYFCLINQ